MPDKCRLHLVQLAGGKGMRARGPAELPPKQFRDTGRGMLFTVSLVEFLKLPTEVAAVANIIVTVPDAWRQEVAPALDELPTSWQTAPWQLAPAGDSRTQSTFNALQALMRNPEQDAPRDSDLVAVHDAARPFADAVLLQRLVVAAQLHGAAVPGVSVADTIVRVAADHPAAYLPRPELLAVQTPQVFRWDLLLDAHQWAASAGLSFTDDGGLVAARGHAPVVVNGQQDNWKVTTGSDWMRAADLLR